MRTLLALALLVAGTSTAACAARTDAGDPGAATEGAAVVTIEPDVVRLRYAPRLVLDHVLAQKQRPFDPERPFPAIRFASETTLEEFQDAIEPQWGFRPDVITNAYSVTQNTIYLMDGAPYYAAHGRCIDDSLAHELTHYVQVVYQGWTLDGADDSIEMDAIHIQRMFREEFCRPATATP